MTQATKDERQKTKVSAEGHSALWHGHAPPVFDSKHWHAFVLRPSSFVVVLFFLALLLRLYHLSTQSLWLDELNTWSLVTQASWGFLWNELWRGESAYPLYHLLLKGWVALAGDSEWAMRFPSALAGAGAVLAVGAAGEELRQETRDGRREMGDKRRQSGFLTQNSKLKTQNSSLVTAHHSSLIAAMLMLLSPFALWYAQEVKTYSLLLLTSALTVWLLLRALRLGTRGSWIAWGVIALISVFVHRFALLLVLGCAAAWVVAQTRDAGHETRDARHAMILDRLRRRLLLPTAYCLLPAVSLILVWQMTQGIGSEGASTGAHIPAAPAEAVWITLWRFVLDRGPGEAPWIWLLPALVLGVWGAVLLLRDAWRGHTVARALLCCGGLPLTLFLAQLWWTRLFEPRYLMIVYPVWVLLLTYPFGRPEIGDRRPETGEQRSNVSRLTSHVSRLTSPTLIALTLAASVASLFQPGKGLWSGAPVKEQYREAVRYIAQRAHPDDVIVLHPEYLRPAWNYYAPRVTADPLPTPVAFDAFKQGQTHYSQSDWNTSREKTLNGHLRSFLLIAPPHARTVDQPDPKHPDDEYGLVGLYYQYSPDQSKWSCGGWRFNGVHVFCQSSPEPYASPGTYVSTPEPQTALHATFGDDINLRGYTLAPFGGTLRAGGTLPITLFWDVTQQPHEDDFVFLHLCRDCTLPPVASDDGPSLGGGLPTSTWKPTHPIHDERAVVLPKDLPPGRYTLLLGLYRPGDPSPNARLQVSGTTLVNDNRVIIGTVDIVGS